MNLSKKRTIPIAEFGYKDLSFLAQRNHLPTHAMSKLDQRNNFISRLTHI
jgi:hypothetical protein